MNLNNLIGLKTVLSFSVQGKFIEELQISINHRIYLRIYIKSRTTIIYTLFFWASKYRGSWVLANNLLSCRRWWDTNKDTDIPKGRDGSLLVNSLVFQWLRSASALRPISTCQNHFTKISQKHNMHVQIFIFHLKIFIINLNRI